MSYKGRIAKHNVEVKKAVFVENTSQDEGVSLSATPGSSNEEQQGASGSPASANNPSGNEGKDEVKEAKEVCSNNVPKEEGSFQCEKCEYVASKKVNLVQHTKRLHSGLSFTCSHCHEEFGNEIKLNKKVLFNS